ncbi:MAG: GNAT family N-acetyltransferase [Proteobacteria bacterium]|jgi:phosphinothricin acetyltransferase|nr:N-acetyltransferase [Desulfocapsa sp.]MBU3945379.1 GNAT family N-acetyltransferase [Pseudomonadota bacterium]MCG2743294.1 N-acetyltransferase family protein [Desulfobacteraceae bacterium]MBU4029362.1 GNAT family N-acetyltransferase [Pseudomonadota bacterium]MBU4042627.1 GNAT family N-acetyltransferase [Pseudomonadota bacterium]
MHITDCTHKRHAESILGILNEAIETSTAIYDYTPRPLSSMEGWFRSKKAGGFPVIGLESEESQLLGFACYGTFRGWPAFKYTVEHSVYVHRDHRGQGLGLKLMQELIAVAKAQERHVLIGGVDAANKSSISLHRKLGFVHAGTIKQAGFKFGRWLDLAFYQLTLETPSAPIDG